MKGGTGTGVFCNICESYYHSNDICESYYHSLVSTVLPNWFLSVISLFLTGSNIILHVDLVVFGKIAVYKTKFSLRHIN